MDSANHALHFTRIGGGGNRTFHLDPIRVRAGETFDFTNSKLTNSPTLNSPPLWACYDSDRVSLSTHPDNKWQKLIRYRNDVAEISPEGVLTAKKPGESVVLATAPDGTKEFFAVTVE